LNEKIGDCVSNIDKLFFSQLYGLTSFMDDIIIILSHFFYLC